MDARDRANAIASDDELVSLTDADLFTLTDSALYECFKSTELYKYLFFKKLLTEMYGRLISYKEGESDV